MRLIFLLLVLEIETVLSQRRRDLTPQEKCKLRSHKPPIGICDNHPPSFTETPMKGVGECLKRKDPRFNMTESPPLVFMACGADHGACLPTTDGFTYAEVHYISEQRWVSYNTMAEELLKLLEKHVPVIGTFDYELGCMAAGRTLVCFAMWEPRRKASQKESCAKTKDKKQVTQPKKGRERPDRQNSQGRSRLPKNGHQISQGPGGLPSSREGDSHGLQKMKDETQVTQPKDGPDHQDSHRPGDPLPSPQGEPSVPPMKETEGGPREAQLTGQDFQEA